MTKVEFLDIPREFLGAAVLIDDDLDWSAAPNQISPEPEALEHPDDFGGATETIENAAGKVESPVNAELVVDGFSDLGLVCSTYRWRDDHAKVPNSTEKADLIIIDWKLKDGDEKIALNILINRLQEDLKNRKRLRYIAVYTNENPDKVLDAVVGGFNEKVEGVSAIREGEAVTVKLNTGASVWRVKHFSKDIDEKKLASCIVNDFASFQDGLLPRTVMAAVAEIKNHAYEHLFRFNSELDLALTTHLLDKRSSELEFPTSHDSFFEYATTLVLDDVASALFSSDILTSATSAAEITRILNLDQPRKLKLFDQQDNDAKDFEKSDLETAFFADNYEDFRKIVQEKFSVKDKKYEPISKGRRPVTIPNVAMDSLSMLSYLDQTNSYPRRSSGRYQLKSGSIVKTTTGQETNYFLCLQPVCDAVRLEEKTSFPLLKLETVEARKNFRFPIKDGTSFVYLACTFKLTDVEMAIFSPCSDTRDVRSEEKANSSTQVFVCENGTEYTWVAELKEHYAAEAQSALAAQGGRIGNNKFEWLRRKAS